MLCAIHRFSIKRRTEVDQHDEVDIKNESFYSLLSSEVTIDYLNKLEEISNDSRVLNGTYHL